MKHILYLITALIIPVIAFPQEEVIQDNSMELSVGIYSFELTPEKLGTYINPGLSLSGIVNKPRFSYGIMTDMVPSIIQNGESDLTTSMITFRGVFRYDLINKPLFRVSAAAAGGMISINNEVGGMLGGQMSVQKWFTPSQGIQLIGSYNRLDPNINTKTSNLYTIHLGYVHRFRIKSSRETEELTKPLPPMPDSILSSISFIKDTLSESDIENLSSTFREISDNVWDAPDIKRLAIKKDTIYFDFDSNELTEESKMKLDNLASFRTVTDVYVEGYTDNIGPQEYNKRLAEDRALSVLDYLPSNSSAYAGMSESDAPWSNSTKQGRSKNRCAIVQITYQI